jgi:hypothetical protein
MSFWNKLFGAEGAQKSSKAELTSPTLNCIEQADKIPMPTEQTNFTLNLLGRALHHFVIALRAQTRVSPRKDLSMFHDFLTRMRLILDQQKSTPDDLVAMVRTRLNLLLSALEILESGTSVTDAIQPSPDQIALWANIISNRQSGESNQTVETKKELAMAEVKLRKLIKDYIQNFGFERTINTFLNQEENAAAAAGLLVICAEIEDWLPTKRDPKQLASVARLMIICSSAWAERALLAGGYMDTVELLRQHHQRSIKRG